VTIVGLGFEADATVKIGPVKIDKYTMTADGSTISGVMPAVAKFTFAQPAPDDHAQDQAGTQ